MSEEDPERIVQMNLIGEDDDPVVPGVDLDPYLNANVEWIGLPKFEVSPSKRLSLVLAFETEEERDQLVAQLGLFIAKKTRGTWSAWWPPREQDDLVSLRFDFGE